MWAERLSQITWTARPGLVWRSMWPGEVAEVHRPVLGGQVADHRAGGSVQRGEQVHRAVPGAVEVRRSGTQGIIGTTGAVRARAWTCGF